MPVNLSIKEVPDDLAERLRRRAARNHRSLQRELMAIVEAAVAELASAPTGDLIAATPAAPAYGVRDTVAAAAPAVAGGDGLLDALDAVVAGSRWGEAPLLTREQTHDRRLQREMEYDAQRAPAAR